MPRPRPNPANVAVPTLIRLQPGLARPWPTVMLEVGNSESVRHLAVIRDRVLGHHTQVNVFVGISYNRNKTRTATVGGLPCHPQHQSPQPSCKRPRNVACLHDHRRNPHNWGQISTTRSATRRKYCMERSDSNTFSPRTDTRPPTTASAII
jgi:hypothetical protein